MERMLAIRLKVAILMLAALSVFLRRIYVIVNFRSCICSVNYLSTILKLFRAEAKELSSSSTSDTWDQSSIGPVYTIGDGKLESVAYESSTEVLEMSSAEVLRSSMTPLGMNNSLNIQRNETNTGSLSSGMSSFMQSDNSDRVPLDRPLFVNTSMTAQQRIDIYRRLSGPPQDDEPALLFRWA